MMEIQMEVFRKFVQAGSSDELWMLLKVYVVNRRLEKVGIIVDELELRDREDKENVRRTVETERRNGTKEATETTKGKGTGAGARDTGKP